MAFVSGFVSTKSSVKRTSFCGKQLESTVPSYGRAKIVMKDGEEDDFDVEDKRRGLGLFIDDVTSVLFEKAPTRVVGSTQDYSVESTIQPGEYGYVDPLKKQKPVKFSPVEPLKSKDDLEGVEFEKSSNALPGEYGYKDPLLKKKEVKMSTPSASATEAPAALPDFMTGGMTAALPKEDPYAGLPDYLRPIEEDSPKSTWSNV